jgi:hypothetical protein
MMSFWRNVQYQNLPIAYRQLSDDLQQSVSYKRFGKAMYTARPVFLNRPRVSSVEREGDRVVVYLTVQQYRSPKPADPPLAFNFIRQGAEWRIATDPANALGTDAGA